MKKRVMLVCSVGLFAAFALFIVLYQNHVIKRESDRVLDHANVVASSLWTFEKNSPTAYLTLAAEESKYRKITVQDADGRAFLGINGPAPSVLDGVFMSVRLIPEYRLSQTIQFQGKAIGTITASWPCRAVYLYTAILFYLLLLLAGIWLFLKVLDAKHTLESRVKERTRELEEENRQRKETEEALRFSEERLRLALEGASDGIWDWNHKTDTMYFSPQYYRMLGYEPDEFPASFESWEALVHPEDVDRSKRVIFEAINACSAFSIEFRARRKDGCWRWILGRGNVAQVDNNGEPVRLAGSHTDITERKEAEIALRESEQKFRMVVENAQPIIFFLDENGVFLLSEGLGLSALGHAPGEVVGKSALEIYKEFPSITDAIRKALAGDTVRIVHRIGDVFFDTSYSPYLTAEGEKKGVVGIAIDVTRQMQAQDALRKYERIVSSSQDMMALINTDYLFEAVNDSTLVAMGKSRVDIVGQPVVSVTGDQVFEEFFRPVLADVFSGKTVRRQHTVEIPDMGARTLEITVIPVLDKKHVPEGAVFNARDITDTRKLEEQLVQAQKIESLGTMAGGVAHEINNPINGVMNYAQLILDRQGADEKINTYAKEILHETGRIATIVRNMLTFARNEKQAHSLASISDIVDAVLSLVQTVMRHDQIDLEWTIPENLPKIKCRSQQIQQVIMNLMTNARDSLNERYPDYSPEKRLCLKAEQIEKKDRPFIRITVEDTGAGVPPEVRDRIFDPFFTTKPKDRGTGLGLSISYGIVRDHKGDLLLENDFGNGACFHVDLPVDNEWVLGG